jgi:MFS family permease
VLRENARNNVLNAVFGAVALNLINQYVGIFAVKLGASNLQLGYLSSWPQLASVVAVLAVAGAVSRTSHQQLLTAGIYLVGRASGLLAAAVPWLPERMRVWALIGAWVLVVFPTAAAGNAMQSFLADVFPGNERGKAFASRNAWATGAGTTTILVSGLLLDYVLPYPLGYQLMFAGSFAVALVEVYYFLRLKQATPPGDASGDDMADSRRPEPRTTGVQGLGWQTLRRYAATFAYQPYRRFLLVSIPFHFTWQMAWPIFTRWQVTDLGANNTWLSILSVAGSLASIVAFPIWARLAERHGNLVMMGFAALNLATAPLLSALFATLEGQAILNLWTGMGVAGVTLLILNGLLDSAPVEDRTVYLAVHSALVSVSASIAPMAGAYLMSALPTRWALGLCTIPRFLTALGFFLLVSVQRREGKGPVVAKRSSSEAV